MDESRAISEVHRTIIERYPMYREEPAFESWLYRKAGVDTERIAEYLDTLADYGILDGEGMIHGDYAAMPDPSGMVEDMRKRLDALDERTRAVLRVASIEGPTFSAEVVAYLDEAPLDEVSATIDRAIESGVVHADGGEAMFAASSRRYRFHPLQLRELLVEEIASDHRVELHRRAIEFLTRELERSREPGAREMIGQLIEEHSREMSRPAGSDG